MLVWAERHWGDHLASLKKQTVQVWLPSSGDRLTGLLFGLGSRDQGCRCHEISEDRGVSLFSVQGQSLGVQVSSLGHQK